MQVGTAVICHLPTVIFLHYSLLATHYDPLTISCHLASEASVGCCPFGLQNITMENLPLYIPVVFGLTTAATLLALYRASRRSTTVLVLSLSWLGLQAAVGLSGFYTVTQTVPPRLVFALLPPVVLVVFCFAT